MVTPRRLALTQTISRRVRSASGPALFAIRNSCTRCRGRPRKRPRLAFSPRFRISRRVSAASSFQSGVSGPGRTVPPRDLRWRFLTVLAASRAVSSAMSNRPSARRSRERDRPETSMVRGIARPGPRKNAFPWQNATANPAKLGLEGESRTRMNLARQCHVLRDKWSGAGGRWLDRGALAATVGQAVTRETGGVKRIRGAGRGALVGFSVRAWG